MANGNDGRTSWVDVAAHDFHQVGIGADVLVICQRCADYQIANSYSPSVCPLLWLANYMKLKHSKEEEQYAQ
jgi:hypothetical protein